MKRNCIEFRNCGKVAAKLASLDFLAYLLFAETPWDGRRLGEGVESFLLIPSPHPLSYTLSIFYLPHLPYINFIHVALYSSITFLFYTSSSLQTVLSFYYWSHIVFASFFLTSFTAVSLHHLSPPCQYTFPQASHRPCRSFPFTPHTPITLPCQLKDSGVTCILSCVGQHYLGNSSYCSKLHHITSYALSCMYVTSSHTV